MILTTVFKAFGNDTYSSQEKADVGSPQSRSFHQIDNRDRLVLGTTTLTASLCYYAFNSLWSSNERSLSSVLIWVVSGSALFDVYRHESTPIAVKKIAAHALRPVLGSKLSNGITPGPKPDYYNHDREKALEMIGKEHQPETIQIESFDGAKLDGIWIPPEGNLGKVVIIFPGNTVTAGTLWPIGKWYHKQGFAVLMMTMRGYVGKDGMGSEGSRDGIDGEIPLIKDAFAALNYVENQGYQKEDITVHGYSTGGYFAACCAYYRQVGKVILDRSFTSFAAVASRITKGFLSEKMIEQVYPTPPQVDPEITATGFSTLSLVEKSFAKYLVIQADKDRFMPVEFGRQFSENRNVTLISVQGEHAIETIFSDRVPNFPAYNDETIGEEALTFKEPLQTAMSSFLLEG